MIGLFMVAGALALLALLSSRGETSRGATVDELAAARAIAAARLRRYAEEREERFRAYHTAWATRRRVAATGSGYLLPFVADGRR